MCEVGQEEVVLKTGKLANRRTLHFALQSLLALFGKYDHMLMFTVLVMFFQSFDRTLCNISHFFPVSLFRLHRTAQASEPG